MQRTITVQHPGDHNATGTAIEAALDAELKAEGVTRTGDISVLESTNTSGLETKLKLTFPSEKTAEKPKRTPKAKAAPADEPEDVQAAEPLAVAAVEQLPVEEPDQTPDAD